MGFGLRLGLRFGLIVAEYRFVVNSCHEISRNGHQAPQRSG